MRFSDLQKERHKDRVRQVLALNPRVSVSQIQDALAQSSHPLELPLTYIAKLVKKIEGERVHRFDWVIAAKRLSEMQDLYAEISNALWQVLLDNGDSATGRKGTTPGEKVYAASQIAKLEADLLKAQMDMGIFERKLGTLDVNGKTLIELPQSHQKLLVSAFAKAGITIDIDDDGKRTRVIDATATEAGQGTQPAPDAGAGSGQAAPDGSGGA